MIRYILVPLDGSPFAEHALPLAMTLARHAGATLHLVQVHVPVLAVNGVTILDDRLDRTLRDRERVYLEDVRCRVADRVHVPVLSALPIGGVADELIEQARQCAADLIVMTTHGRGALSRLWLGSIADEMMRHGLAPVLLMRPPEGPVDLAVEPTPRHMLIPLDGTPDAERVLPAAVELAGLFDSACTLLEVVPPVPILGYDVSGYATGGTDVALLGQLQESARAYVSRVQEWLTARVRRADTDVIVNEQPAHAILEEARARGCDLIALQTHGRGGLSRLVLGSVADRVVRGASCAVLVNRGPYPGHESARPGVAESAAHGATTPRGVGILP
jgi:nucleotide-binding universal stress UspA family protein